MTIRNAGIPFIIGGYVLMFIGNIAMRSGDAGVLFGFLFWIVGLLVNIGGCMKYAEEKGHSKWMGLVGIFACVGLLILLMMPDRYRAMR